MTNTRDVLVHTTRLTPAELFAWIRSDDPPLVLDVRSAVEVCQGMMPEAHHRPLSVLREHLAKLDRRRPIVVYSESGVRSMIAARLLEEAGFDRVADLLGGYVAWRAYRKLTPIGQSSEPM